MSRTTIKEGVCAGVLFVTASVALSEESEALGEDESLGEGDPPDEDVVLVTALSEESEALGEDDVQALQSPSIELP